MTEIPAAKRTVYFYLALAFICFNCWHLSIRKFWNGSIKDSLDIGPDVIGLAQKYDKTFAVKGGYDGQFFYAIATDPFFLKKENVSHFDVPRYRARRILYPLFGWILSFGQIGALPYSLFLANMLALILIGRVGFQIAREEGFPRIITVFGLVTITGVTFSVVRTLSEPLALALVLWGCFFWKKGNRIKSAISFGLAGLSRENSLLVPVTILVFTLFQRIPIKSRICFVAISFLPIILWSVYLLYVFPVQAYSYSSRLGLPMSGIVKELRWLLSQHPTKLELLRTLSAAAVIGGIIIFVVSGFWFFPSLWGALALTEAIFCSMLHGDIWNYYAGSIRISVHLMAFFFLWTLEIQNRKEKELSLDTQVHIYAE